MNKLRQSFRRKKDVYVPESSRPHQWQTDEEAVRSGKCSFAVKVTPPTLFAHRDSNTESVAEAVVPSEDELNEPEDASVPEPLNNMTQTSYAVDG